MRSAIVLKSLQFLTSSSVNLSLPHSVGWPSLLLHVVHLTISYYLHFFQGIQRHLNYAKKVLIYIIYYIILYIIATGEKDTESTLKDKMCYKHKQFKRFGIFLRKYKCVSK